MNTKVIYGTELAAKVKERIKNDVRELEEDGCRAPKLVVIQVGDNPSSDTYVRNKVKACEEVGFKSEVIKFDNTYMARLKYEIEKLNSDRTVDGILVQMPLPGHLNENKVISKIDPKKDVDGLHPVNSGELFKGHTGGHFVFNDCLVPCTPLGIMEILREAEVELEGKHAVVLGRSPLVGMPVAKLLLDSNCTVTVCHSKTTEVDKICREADILIAAVGKPKMVKRDWIKEGAVVIDVGINRVDGKLVGDVDFDDVMGKAGVITPVPKGVGAMTVAMLLQNTLKAYEREFGGRYE